MGIEEQLVLDIVQFSLDMVGIVEPTPFADATSGLISLARGEWLNAAISGASMLPYLGDMAKLGKLPKYAHSVAEAIKLAARDERFATHLRPALLRLKEALERVPLGHLPASASAELRRILHEIELFVREETVLWKRQLLNPGMRQFNAEYHGEVALLRKTKMDLPKEEAEAVLRSALYEVSEAGAKAPSLWGIKDGKIYRFFFDNQKAWHGYPVTGVENPRLFRGKLIADEKPPTSILREWVARGDLSRAEYKKMLHLLQRGK